MKANWKGHLNFGLVNVPIELHSAVQESKGKVEFRLLHKGCGAPIRYDRVCEKHQESVPWDSIGKGFEHTKGEYVMLDDEDFAAATIESSKVVEITQFVAADKIDPRYFEKPYFLLPQKGAERGYALVCAAMAKTGTVGIGLLAMRANSQHVVGIKAAGDALVLTTMRYDDELVNIGNFSFPDGDALVKPQELALAEQLVDSMLGEFKPEQYANQYRNNLMEIINTKLAGKPVQKKVASEPLSTQVVDLFTKLTESLKRTKTG
jgi:DNA end-binding protein Ku